jgi:hypothetical protein
MQRFTELKVWQRAHALVLEIYRIAFDQLIADLDEVARMLHGLRSKVEGA